MAQVAPAELLKVGGTLRVDVSTPKPVQPPPSSPTAAAATDAEAVPTKSRPWLSVPLPTSREAFAGLAALGPAAPAAAHRALGTIDTEDIDVDAVVLALRSVANRNFVLFVGQNCMSIRCSLEWKWHDHMLTAGPHTSVAGTWMEYCFAQLLEVRYDQEYLERSI
eukprot:SAG31_NODE_15687_length_743_cov_0.888199_2_plen_165_part_00